VSFRPPYFIVKASLDMRRALPQLDAMLPPIDHPIALSSAGDDLPFTLGGRRCVITGTERAGIQTIMLDGICAARDCRIANAHATSFLITPLGVQRIVQVGKAMVRERIVIAPQTPAMAIEWEPDSDVEIQLASKSLNTPGVAFLWIEQPNDVRADGRFFVRRGEIVQLIIATEAGTADHLNPSRWIRLHSVAAQRREHDWLSARLPQPEISTALEWAKYRTAVSASNTHSTLLALLGVGEFRTVREQLEGLGSAPSYLALIGRYSAATGDDAFLRVQWPRVTDLYYASATTLSADTLRDLASAAESIGEAGFANDLKRRVRESPVQPTAWIDFENGRTNSAARDWIATAQLCFSGEKGAWPDVERRSAADVIATFVYGLLGLAPDATRSRLRLRPQIPDDWRQMAVENIRMGDARISLEYTRDGDRHKYVLSQSGGAYPVRLVFEPTLSAPLTSATVDGKPAELNSVLLGERIATPMQIMLDELRIVELRTGK
jgi:hypothetical protein